ncbi:hypothetical protein NPIL_451351 [Nephila pilipes]|uniref:Uncharacterized protein n=1 Tax=Nephila pilipes TaxID=299642 RepID=A0A8X6U5X7_NEPPI|nr:hypothetical protein NPIL_451351 [Nephila pilipes]
MKFTHIIREINSSRKSLLFLNRLRFRRKRSCQGMGSSKRRTIQRTTLKSLRVFGGKGGEPPNKRDVPIRIPSWQISGIQMKLKELGFSPLTFLFWNFLFAATSSSGFSFT